MTKRTGIVALLPLLVLAAGCGPLLVLGAAGTAGTGAYVWYRGWVQQTIDQPHDRVHRAARSALDDLDIVVEDETSTQDSGVLDGYDAHSKRVMLKTKAVGEQATQVRIRVGLWGNQERSLQILEQLKKHL
jgi:hypothetical protein